MVDVAGAAVAAHLGDKLIEFVLIFVSEDAEGAGQAVLDRVPAGSGLAVGSTGAGTQSGVVAIG